MLAGQRESWESPLIPRPSRDESLMRSALVWGRRSTCSRADVGAVIAREGRILVQGYNGAPAGLPHCTDQDHPPVTETCRVAIHAEANAIVWAARTGVRLEESSLYVTSSPCPACARLVVNAGIIKVFAHTMYRLTEGWEYLMAAGVATEILTPEPIMI